MPTIRLAGGRRINPFEIEKYTFTAEEFIKPLAKLNRWSGQTLFPYSVAEHTVRLARHKLVREAKLSRAAALHDFNETLGMNDMAHPLKCEMPDYRALEERVQRHLFNVFGEPWENMIALTEFDRRICADEGMQLFEPPELVSLEPLGVECAGWSWEVAELQLQMLCAEVGVN